MTLRIWLLGQNCLHTGQWLQKWIHRGGTLKLGWMSSFQRAQDFPDLRSNQALQAGRRLMVEARTLRYRIHPRAPERREVRVPSFLRKQAG